MNFVKFPCSLRNHRKMSRRQLKDKCWLETATPSQSILSGSPPAKSTSFHPSIIHPHQKSKFPNGLPTRCLNHLRRWKGYSKPPRRFVSRQNSACKIKARSVMRRITTSLIPMIQWRVLENGREGQKMHSGGACKTLKSCARK